MDIAVIAIVVAGVAYLILYPRWKISKLRNRRRPLDNIRDPGDGDPGDSIGCIFKGDADGDRQ